MYQAAIRAGKWKLLMVGANQRFLFDMDQPLDQLERGNLIDQYPDLARTLERRLTAWANQQKPPVCPPLPLSKKPVSPFISRNRGPENIISSDRPRFKQRLPDLGRTLTCKGIALKDDNCSQKMRNDRTQVEHSHVEQCAL